ncbi:hypothetical protein PPERSA_06244 [Pseudocohnilembus persalinus]|uniref:DUF155 domain-containing protein n=1 Tax=Pseudocohnilembus persalinus TaxID=266149 RepID=A0A0V0QVR3_PSEPJ|nr:hypothetical protein PPERSA_06244 [Pseudocohnilembus persalinus]|eukprot:KRX06273.1 hypothetical protein PPERSA_06244 [Pseudocohnilembus persalinus]
MSSNYQKFLDDSENDNAAIKKEKLKEIQQTLQQQSDDHLTGKNENTLQFKKDQLSDNNLNATYYTSNLQNNSTNNDYQKKRKQRMSKDIKPKGVKKHNLPFNSAIHNNENVFRLTTYSLSFDIDLQYIQKNLGKFIQANKYSADQSLQEKTVLILKNIDSPDYKVIFLFEFGVIVFWGLSENEESAIYDHINNLNEDFKFPNLFKPKLDLKIEEPEPDLIYFTYLPSDSNKTIDQNDILHLTGTQLSEKLAFSYAQVKKYLCFTMQFLQLFFLFSQIIIFTQKIGIIYQIGNL